MPDATNQAYFDRLGIPLRDRPGHTADCVRAEELYPWKCNCHAVGPAFTPSQPDTSAGKGMERRARELLAPELEAEGFHHSARSCQTGSDENPWVRACVRAVRAALSTPSAGEGLVLVPREPSEADIQRITHLIEGVLPWREKAIAIWSAVTAAPANPSLSGTGEVERLREALALSDAAASQIAALRPTNGSTEA